MQTGLISLEVVTRINGFDIDTRAIIREHGIDGEEIKPDELIRIARHQKFRAKIKKLGISDIQKKYPLPAIMMFSDESYGVILDIDDKENKALVFMPARKSTEKIDIDELDDLITGEFVILKHREISANAKFGFKWFFKEMAKYGFIIYEILIGSFVVQLFGLITPLFTQVILDKVIVHRTMTTLDILGVAFIAVALFEFLLNVSRKYIFVHTASKMDAWLGAKFFKHLLMLPYVYFESRKVGNIVARVRELDTIRNFITDKSVSVIIDLFFSLVFVVMMALYSVKLVLIVCTFVLMIALIYFFVTPELRRRLEQKFQMGAKSNSYLVESVTGIQTVKSLAIEGSMQKNWEDHLGRYITSSFKLLNMSNISGAFAGLLQKLMTISVLYIGVTLVIDNKMTIGQLIAFQMFSGQFTGPIIRLVNLWNDFQQALLSVDRLGDILNHPIELQSSNAITLPRLNGDIRFDKINFKYVPGAPNVLENINFGIKPGARVGIVGRSGSGKSTLTKLVQRLYVPNDGTVYFDGIDIRHLNPFWLKNNIGVVLQENYLFSGSIRENIAMPRPDAKIELIIHAATIAGAHEFISQMPDGYDTVVGERGSTLSGGQRQRVAIARALITDPRILIFDEATSALDYESEMIIRKNLDMISKNRTVFIISHKLSIVRDCNVIIAMDKGKIIEIGTHEELIDKKGYYHRLYSLLSQGIRGGHYSWPVRRTACLETQGQRVLSGSDRGAFMGPHQFHEGCIPLRSSDRLFRVVLQQPEFGCGFRR